jgi:hypothetical protein
MLGIGAFWSYQISEMVETTTNVLEHSRNNFSNEFNGKKLAYKFKIKKLLVGCLVPFGSC